MNKGNVIHRRKDDDEVRFEELFKFHYPRLIFFANRFLNDMAAAEELVSETFAALWENRDKYSLDSCFSGLLYKMVQNRCLNYIKHQKIENEYVQYLIKKNLLTERSSFEEDKLIAKEFESHIQEAINHLPQRCRQVFKLSRFEHKQNKEIADILNISKKTVERQMSIALQKLRLGLQHLLTLLILFF